MTDSPSLQPPARCDPVRELLPWVIFAGLLAFIALYFVGVEEGATSISTACTCTNSCMTAAICSASPATERGDSHGQDSSCPRHARRHRRRAAGFSFAKIVGEPQVDRAIAFEERCTQPPPGAGAHDRDGAVRRGSPIPAC